MKNKMDVNIWVMRPYIDEKNRADEFLDRGIIATGWQDLPDLYQTNKDKIKKLFQNNYDHSGQKAALNAGMVDRFVNEFKAGDIVFVPAEEEVNIAEVVGDYKYNPKNEVFNHSREVKWFKRNASKHDLPANLQSALKSRMSIYSISKHHDFVAFWLNDNAQSLQDKTMDYTNKFKAVVGLKAITYVGTYSQAHYDIIYFALNELMPEEYEKYAEEVYLQAKFLLEVNNEEKLNDFFSALREGKLTEKIMKERMELDKFYEKNLLRSLENGGKQKITSIISEILEYDMENNLGGDIFKAVNEKISDKKKDLLRELLLETYIQKLSNMDYGIDDIVSKLKENPFKLDDRDEDKEE